MLKREKSITIALRVFLASEAPNTFHNSSPTPFWILPFYLVLGQISTLAKKSILR